LQILLSAYGRLGRDEQVAACSERLKKVLADRNDEADIESRDRTDEPTAYL
jgi:hypothetical protein